MIVALNKLQTEIVISSENTLFSVNPKMSNPAKEFITADPDFWDVWTLRSDRPVDWTEIANDWSGVPRDSNEDQSP